jgi:hypothetical protein
MVKVKLEVWTRHAPDAHKQRAEIIHGLVDALGLKVIEWGETDDIDPHEHVEIIFLLDITADAAGTFIAAHSELIPQTTAAIAQIIKLAVDRDALESAALHFERENGAEKADLSIEKASDPQIQNCIKILEKWESGQ